MTAAAPTATSTAMAIQKVNIPTITLTFIANIDKR